MSIQPSDIAILFVSAAACIYCFVLNRRLKALQDTKDGLGATIVAFSKSVSDMSTSTQQTRTQAGHIADTLAALISDANSATQKLKAILHSSDAMQSTQIQKATKEAMAMCHEIEKVTSDLEDRHRTSIDEVQTAQSILETIAREMGAETERKIIEMKELAQQMRAETARSQFKIEETLERAEKSMILAPQSSGAES